MSRILVVEDEVALREAIAYNLGRQGYEVFQASDGPAAVDLARRESPDAIVLDIMLPGMDGIEVCRVLRQEMSVPIIMLTARTDEIDKVVGLEVGADDYMTKPFSMRELVARVKALLRRVRLVREEMSTRRGVRLGSPNSESSPTGLVFGNLEIDEGRREVLRDGKSLQLKPKEFELLYFLARHRRLALSRDTILQEVWGWDFAGGTRTVDVHVRWLREKIEDDPGSPRRIVTIRGVGYRFEG